MPYEIIIGRSKKDRERYGLAGTILLGRHYVKMGQTVSLSSEVYLDVNRSHVVFVCGKRGSGKSYSLGVIAEGISSLPPEIAKNVAVLIFDTMGIFWTMKYPNYKDALLLKEWNLEGKGLDISIYTPMGFYEKFKEQGIPTDFPFSLKPSELAPTDWFLTFGLDPNSQAAVLIEKTILSLKRRKEDFSIADIIDSVKKNEHFPREVRDLAENHFSRAQEWGLFSTKGTPIEELASPGKVSVLDLSCYATISGTWNIRALVIGIISQKLFEARMAERKKEEYASLLKATRYFSEEEIKPGKLPFIWIMLDEAHEFLPRDGWTAASSALITLLREGRQPGVSLVLASQQPGKIHTDVITQSDVVLSHRLTAKIDVEALGALMQTYMRRSLDAEINALPDKTGAAIIFDDLNERLYPMQVRPRFTWHGGASPTLLRVAKEKP